MDNLVDLWFTQNDGKRKKTQLTEAKAMKMSLELVKTGSNPMIGYLY